MTYSSGHIPYRVDRAQHVNEVPLSPEDLRQRGELQDAAEKARAELGYATDYESWKQNCGAPQPERQAAE